MTCHFHGARSTRCLDTLCAGNRFIRLHSFVFALVNISGGLESEDGPWPLTGYHSLPNPDRISYHEEHDAVQATILLRRGPSNRRQYTDSLHPSEPLKGTMTSNQTLDISLVHSLTVGTRPEWTAGFCVSCRWPILRSPR